MGTLNVVERTQPPGASLVAAMDNVRGEIRVSAPAIVQSFDADTQTVTVLIAIGERVRLGDGELIDVTFKPIADVPIQIPQGGDFVLTFPITAGDECDLLFADGCIDSWFQNGGTQARMDGRRHSISDAVALFGIRSQPRKLANYSTTACQLRTIDGVTMIEIAEDTITIKAATIVLQGEVIQVEASNTAEISATNGVAISSSAAGATVQGTDWATHTHLEGTDPITHNTGPVVP